MTIATPATETKTNPCPTCSEPAPWSDYSKRYICRNHKRNYYVSFVGDSGYCEGNTWSGYSYVACTKKGKPEPATKDFYDSTADAIVQRPNTARDFGSDEPSLEGKTFCGTHSPSRKAARAAVKSQTEHRAYVEKQARQKTAAQQNAEAKERLVNFITAAAESEQEAEDMHKLLDRVIEAEKAALYRRY